MNTEKESVQENSENENEKEHWHPGQLLEMGLAAVGEAPGAVARDILSTMVDYKELLMQYACAIKEVQTKFEILDTEFKYRYSRNLINNIQTRLKSTQSILSKLARHNLDISVESIENHVRDIAGVRIVCEYIDDIYKIASAFLSQDDIVLLEKKDYIRNPKGNGYRSLHLIVEVPVFFEETTKKMPVEVQIRTLAMDFWASLEHKLLYKKKDLKQKEIAEKLQKCAEVIHATDQAMQDIRDEIAEIEEEEEKTEEQQIAESMAKLESPVADF